jgi:hypothetical protein
MGHATHRFLRVPGDEFRINVQKTRIVRAAYTNKVIRVLAQVATIQPHRVMHSANRRCHWMAAFLGKLEKMLGTRRSSMYYC